MNKFLIRLSLLPTLFSAIASAEEKLPAQPANTNNAPGGAQVIAYYFHGTVRCETWPLVEDATKFNRYVEEEVGKLLQESK